VIVGVEVVKHQAGGFWSGGEAAGEGGGA
jgi:hypothetical protein